MRRFFAILVFAGALPILGGCSSAVHSTTAAAPAQQAVVATATVPADVAVRFFEALRHGDAQEAKALAVPGFDVSAAPVPPNGLAIKSRTPTAFPRREIPALLKQHPALRALGISLESNLVEGGVSFNPPEAAPGQGWFTILFTRTDTTAPWRILWVGEDVPPAQGNGG